jgi:hypothetical protein
VGRGEGGQRRGRAERRASGRERVSGREGERSRG